MIRNIVFDIGQVLAHFRWKEYIEEMGYPSDIQELLAKATVQSDMWKELDRGVMQTEEIIAECVRRYPKIKEEIHRLFDDKGKLVTEFPYSRSLIKELKDQGYQVYLLSNYGDDFFKYADKTFTFIPLVDGKIISYSVKKVKPEPEIYQALFDTYELNPEECLFFDDLKANVEGAESLGMNAIQFRTLTQAMEDMELYGVKLNDRNGFLTDHVTNYLKVDHKERMVANLPYKAWLDGLGEERMETKKKLHAFNLCAPDETERMERLLRDILGQAGRFLDIQQPFHCDYGSNITVGDYFFANYNLTILDVGKVTIGDHVFLAPNVGIYTAGHPIDKDARNEGYEYGMDITIGSDVWIGGNVVINPGVTIGDNVVVGSGSVVTKDIESGVIATGNPCRVIRKITEEDREYYFKKRKFFDEAF